MEAWRAELYHHGIKGMKWGIRRWQYSDGFLTPEGYIRYARRNLKGAKVSNLDKWGTDNRHNVCYIIGHSGSGKSTTAIALAKQGDKVIHLDGYSDPSSLGTASLRNHDFDEFLNKELPNWKLMTNAKDSGTKVLRFSKEYWSIVDGFRDAIEKYGAKQFGNGNRVIVEGVQLVDDWFVEDKKYFQDKPVIALGTNAFKSTFRASLRDEISLIELAKNKTVLTRLKGWNAEINKIVHTIGARKISELEVLELVSTGKEYLKGL